MVFFVIFRDQMKNDDGDSLTFGQVLKSTVSGESRPCPVIFLFFALVAE